MPTNLHHHSGLRVSDLERAAQFYIDALDGHWMVKPYTIEGEFASIITAGPRGVAFRVGWIGFDPGCIELFEFIEPAHGMEPVHATRGNIIHIGFQVEDVGATVHKVERAGGRRLWPEVVPFGTAEVIYVLDPDGNVIELADASVHKLAALTIEMFPDADPARG